MRSDGGELHYAYGPEGVSAQQTIAGSTQTIAYPLLDGLGSIRQLTDASGAAILSRSYDAFGNIRHTNGAGKTTLGFTGERMGTVGGTLYLRARHYSPALGRFLQRDTFAGVPTRPQSLNRYTYTGNNPVNRTDPSGHDWEQLKRFSAGAVKGMGKLGGAVASLFKRETWDRARCGALRLAFQPDLAAGIVRGHIGDQVNQIVRGWQFATKDTRGALQALADDPEGVGELLGGIVADGAFGAYAEARAARLRAAAGEAAAEEASAVRRMLCSGANSFRSDTLVATPDGEKPISKIKVGDQVLAYDEATGTTGNYTVTAVLVHLDSTLIDLTIDGELIETTPEHPFFTNSKT